MKNNKDFKGFTSKMNEMEDRVASTIFNGWYREDDRFVSLRGDVIKHLLKDYVNQELPFYFQHELEAPNEREEETLVIWRNTEEKSNKDLNDFFSKMEFSTRDTEFDRIYVNGDNHLENLKIGDEKWKVVLIEEEFTKRMFDVQDV